MLQVPSTTTPAMAETPLFNHPLERVPSNWIITSTDDGIHAINRLTQKVFEGSIEDFNKAMRD